MAQGQKERDEIPVAAEARPVLDYAKPKPVTSIWRLGEIACRYGYAAAVATIGTAVLQMICALLLSSLPRKIPGDALIIPFWLFIVLVGLIPPSAASGVVWKLLGHPAGRLAVVAWTFSISVLFAIANDVAYYKAWSRGW